MIAASLHLFARLFRLTVVGFIIVAMALGGLCPADATDVGTRNTIGDSAVEVMSTASWGDHGAHGGCAASASTACHCSCHQHAALIQPPLVIAVGEAAVLGWCILASEVAESAVDDIDLPPDIA